MFETANSVLIREVSLIQSVLRGSNVYSPFFHSPYLHLIHQVLKVLSVEDREMYALKVVSLTNSAMEEALANEVRILKKLQGHPQIVQLKEL